MTVPVDSNFRKRREEKEPTKANVPIVQNTQFYYYNILDSRITKYNIKPN